MKTNARNGGELRKRFLAGTIQLGLGGTGHRPVLGGNGSSEVRVWAMGLIRRGKYPHIGEMVEEFADKAKNSPGTYEEFGDAQKEAHVRAEKNIKLFLKLCDLLGNARLCRV